MAATPAGVFGSRQFPVLGAIDGGATFRDKRPVLGTGKTWAGFIGGTLMAGLFCAIVATWMKVGWQTPNWLVAGLALGGGALMGDILKSFVKRRLNFANDTCMPVADQLDFLIGGGAAFVLLRISQSQFFATNVPWKLTPNGFFWVCGIMLVLHPAVNYIAFVLKLKRVRY